MAPALVAHHESPNVLTLRVVEQNERDEISSSCALLRSERETRSAYNGTSRLLKLPLELRNRICEYALIEPKMWDKRHLPSCEWHAAPDAFELPPFRCFKRVEPHTRSDRHNSPDENDDEARHACARRKGLGLLVASTQIYGEAADIYYNNNTFCFGSAESFVRAHHLLSYAARSKVRRISILETRDRTVSRSSFTEGEQWRDEMLCIMASMPGLKDLELPLRYVQHDYKGALVRLRKVESITVLATDAIGIYYGYSLSPGCVALARRYEVPFCSDRRHWSTPSCRHCCEFFDGLREEVQGLVRPLTRRGEAWYSHVRSKLEAKDASHRTFGQPYRMYIPLQGFGKTEVRVWGLPRQSKKETQGLEDKKMWKKLLAEEGVRPRRHPAVKYVTEEDEDELGVRQGRSARHYCHRQEQAKMDRETMLRQRSNRRANEGKRRKFDESEARKSQGRAKAQAMEEARMQRKVESKRSGRR